MPESIDLRRLFKIRSGLQDATEIGAAKELDDDDIQRANTEISRLMDRDVLKQRFEAGRCRVKLVPLGQYVDENGHLPSKEAVDELEEDLGQLHSKDGPVRVTHHRQS